jgi:uncharacterized protein YqjF (DUF2071 family)
LTAEWRYLLMLNYEVDPAVLDPLVPAGTRLDLWEGRALASMVGFLFTKTLVSGLPIPFHRAFEEVNLRFYVQRETPHGARRGVVFVKELVPRPAIAGVARWVYGENYVALPMRHTIETVDGRLRRDGLVEYAWRFQGRLNRMGGLASGDPQPLRRGSEEEFVAEHYWGYTRRGPAATGEYRVEHPAWQARSVTQPYLLCNLAALYGQAFEPFLRRRPRSAFLAEGSPVAVYPGENFTVKDNR